MKTKLPKLAIAAAIMFPALTGESPAGATRDVPQALGHGNTASALDLYQRLKSEEGSLSFSPFSLSTALAMTFVGAQGETERDLAEA